MKFFDDKFIKKLFNNNLHKEKRVFLDKQLVDQEMYSNKSEDVNLKTIAAISAAIDYVCEDNEKTYRLVSVKRCL